MVDLTVAICTYNGANLIPEILEKLRSQVKTEAINWEIIVVDNNSSDNTAQVMKNYQQNWSCVYPLRYCFASEQGLSFARRCAIKQAKGTIVAFLDDDNLPASDWVAQVALFAQKHPQAGAYGGQIHPLFEVEPPIGFERIGRFFALFENQETFCYNQKYKSKYKRMFPPGAGIVFRKQAWLNSVPERPILRGVAGKSLLSKGEDLETLSYIRDAGWELWFNAQMHIEHKIPKSRLERAYLMRFFKGVGISRYKVRMLKYKDWQKPLITPLYMLNDLRNTCTYFWKNRNFLNEDVVIAAEMRYLLSSFLSPIYHILICIK